MFTQDWDDFQQDIHQKRLKHMKPVVRKFMESPKEGLSMETREAKRKALKRARYLDIELENKVLLNKLSHLMRHPAEIFQAMAGEKLGPTSLNKITRKKEYKRINRENNKLCRGSNVARENIVGASGPKRGDKLKNIWTTFLGMIKKQENENV